MKKAVSCEHHFTARWKGRGGQPSHRPGGSEAAFISTLQLDSVLPRLGMLRRLTGPASRFDHSQRCSGPVLPKSLSAFHASQRSRRGRRQSLSIAGKHCSSGCFAFFVCCCSSGDGAIVEVSLHLHSSQSSVHAYILSELDTIFMFETNRQCCTITAEY